MNYLFFSWCFVCLWLASKDVLVYYFRLKEEMLNRMINNQKGNVDG